jgi:hypothetical protein
LAKDPHRRSYHNAQDLVIDLRAHGEGRHSCARSTLLPPERAARWCANTNEYAQITSRFSRNGRRLGHHRNSLVATSPAKLNSDSSPSLPVACAWLERSLTRKESHTLPDFRAHPKLTACRRIISCDSPRPGLLGRNLAITNRTPHNRTAVELNRHFLFGHRSIFPRRLSRRWHVSLTDQIRASVFASSPE